MRYKVLKGRELHSVREKINTDYLRKRISCVNKETSVYLASTRLKIRGIVDEVLYLKDGSLAPLDYKFAEYNEFTFKTHRIQSSLYAMLIMDNYKKDVKKGFLCYTRGGNKLKEIYYSESDFIEASRVIAEIFRIIERGYFPKKTKFDVRCVDCCYRNICPK